MQSYRIRDKVSVVPGQKRRHSGSGCTTAQWCIDHPEPKIVSGRPAQALALLDRARILSIGRLANWSYIGGHVRR